MWVVVTLVAAVAMVAFLAFCGWLFTQPDARQEQILTAKLFTIPLIALLVALQALSWLVRL